MRPIFPFLGDAPAHGTVGLTSENIEKAKACFRDNIERASGHGIIGQTAVKRQRTPSHAARVIYLHRSLSSLREIVRSVKARREIGWFAFQYFVEVC
jgi:hypothetical protein